MFTGGQYGDGLGGTYAGGNLYQVPIWHAGYPIVGDFDGSGHISLATYDINSETFYFQLWDPTTDKWGDTPAYRPTIYVGGDGIQLGATTRPVAADMDQDGITDIGLYTPEGTGGTSSSPSDWYFWTSDAFTTNTQGQTVTPPVTPIPGTVVTLNHPFSSITLGGHDLFAQMGNTYAMPIVGNFDPPVGDTPAPTPAPIPNSLTVTLAGTAKADTFAFAPGTAANTWSITLDGVTKTYTAASIVVYFNGQGGKDTAIVHGSGANQSAVLKPGEGDISGPGYSLHLLARSITVDAGGGSGQAAFSGESTKKNVFTASPTAATMCDTSATAWTDYYDSATGFRQVSATATLGKSDQATISDGGIASLLAASGHTAKLSSLSTQATDYVLSLFDFGSVTATLKNKASVKSVSAVNFLLTVK